MYGLTDDVAKLRSQIVELEQEAKEVYHVLFDVQDMCEVKRFNTIKECWDFDEQGGFDA
ncbi:MAG: hypothetical protein ACXABY_12140 [Candidatus Thorarchaeota archaeon]|jgi:hypothetical protein